MVYFETGSTRELKNMIEAGRKLFSGQCNFVAAAGNMNSLPRITLPEVCFAGRSNVGKSSLLNALTGRRTLARTSQTPGRTRQLIFFNLAKRLQLVDLPGYGFASASKTDIVSWNKLTQNFFCRRPTLKRVFLLIDSRRGVGSADQKCMTFLDAAAVSWAVVITKADKVKPHELKSVCTESKSVINSHVAAYPELFVTSSQNGDGIKFLRGHLSNFALPHTVCLILETFCEK